MSGAPSPYRTVIESMFQIVNKDGVRVPFRLNSVQARLDANWHRRQIIPKARQTTVSSYVIARYTAKCLAQENRTCVIISHEAEATARLLGRADYILSNLKGGLSPELGRHSRNEIYFKKTNSTFFIGTAGSRAFGHGDTITDLHLSEASRYPDAESIVRGAFPAAERGEITVESTGNGVGNWFHRQCVRAREGIGMRLHFFAWTDNDEYQLPFPSPEARSLFLASLRSDIEEPELLAAGVSAEQLAWRRERLYVDFEGDLRAFKESYPFTFDECFQSTGYGFFRRVRYVETDAWERTSANLYVLRNHPAPGLSYVIGADPSGGVGRDNAVAQVFCLETAEQVAEFASAQAEPPEFADEVAALGRRFNNAYVNVERNNHGGTVLARLLDTYPLELLHRGSHGEEATQEILSRLSHFGTAVTASSRGLILGTARRLLADEFTVHSPALRSELATFVETDSGKVEADSGCFDDRVMAAVHALIVTEPAGIAAVDQRRAPYEPATEPDPFSFDALFGKQTDALAGGAITGTPARFH
jgi:hypothetical protein